MANAQNLAIFLIVALEFTVGFANAQQPKDSASPGANSAISEFAGGSPNASLATLIAEGERLFFQETFNGNGRTCGTCHVPHDGFGVSPATIATLPANDPLFIAETNPDLSTLEFSPLMRGPRGLILENIDGFEKSPVFRGSPHLLNIALTAPYGLSGEIANLRDFAVGAVTQHFPKTLNRMEGVDFRLPTAAEDVSSNHLFFPFIEAVYRAGMTSGCSEDPLIFCPDSPLSRAQAA